MFIGVWCKAMLLCTCKRLSIIDYEHINLKKMNRLGFNTEPLYNYKVHVKMPDGTTMVTGCLAHSKWHAVDKKYTELHTEQDDRECYSAYRVYAGLIGVDRSLLS